MKRPRYTDTLATLRHLSDPAARIFCLGLRLCCALLVCACVLLLCSRPLSYETYPLFRLAGRLQQLNFLVFFCTAFLGCFAEEQMLKRQ